MKKFTKKLVEATGEMLTAITSNGRTEVLPAEVTETVVMKAYDGDRAKNLESIAIGLGDLEHMPRRPTSGELRGVASQLMLIAEELRTMDEALLDMYKKWVSGEVGILNDHEQMYLLLEEKFGVLDE